MEGSTTRRQIAINRRAFWGVVLALIILIVAAIAGVQVLLPGRLAEAVRALFGY